MEGGKEGESRSSGTRVSTSIGSCWPGDTRRCSVNLSQSLTLGCPTVVLFRYKHVSTCRSISRISQLCAKLILHYSVRWFHKFYKVPRNEGRIYLLTVPSVHRRGRLVQNLRHCIYGHRSVLNVIYSLLDFLTPFLDFRLNVPLDYVRMTDM